MKTAIIFASKTGHSKKIADAIAKEIATPALDAAQKPIIEDIDLLFIIGGIYGGQSTPELLEYVHNLESSKIKNAVLITSCVSKSAKQEEVRRILKEKNINVMEEEFICQGNFLFIGLKHPNKNDIENAVSFCKSQVNHSV
jgi:flavodoxin